METHAEVPGMVAFKLAIARADLKYRRASSTDYDVAFMQAFNFKDFGMTDVLVKWYDYREKKWKYGFLEGATYGMQVCMRLWKMTHGQHLSKLGFKEVMNQRAIYYHAELDILIICHVDDPWIDVGLGKEHDQLTNERDIDAVLATKEKEIHDALSERFKTKGVRRLTSETPIDYLSMIVGTDDGESIYIQTDKFNEKILKTYDMVGCNPTTMPVTKELLRACEEDVKEGKFLDKEGIKNYQKARGIFNWKAQTIGVDMAMANSVCSKYNARPVEACEALIKHQVRYVAGIIGQKLRNKPKSENTLVVASDSDVGGMHAITGDTRSRGCAVITYKDMVVDYWTGWVGECTSSGQAEIYAMSQALRRAMHVKYLGEEMGIPMPRVISIYVDATVAISFAADVGAPTGMKFIDLRQGWVMELRDKDICRTTKVDTKLNPADFGTKILTPGEFKRQRAYFLDTPPHRKEKKEAKQVLKLMEQVEECKGIPDKGDAVMMAMVYARNQI